MFSSSKSMESVETEQTFLSLRSINKFKGVINAYHQSIGRHGPYDIQEKSVLSWPVKMSCLVVHGKVRDYRDKCLYICDTAAFKRLEEALKNVSILDKGAAWPHVKVAYGQHTVEWLMLQNDMKTWCDYSWTPTGKVWFMVSDANQDIIDYVACLHNLAPMRRSLALIDMRFPSSGQRSATELEISVSMIVMHPEDLIASVNTSSESDFYPLCISEKRSFDTTMQEPGPVKAECEYHIIIEVPKFLKDVMVQSKESTVAVVSDAIKEFLFSEITVKEEHIGSDADGGPSDGDILESVRRVEVTSTADTSAAAGEESAMEVRNEYTEKIQSVQCHKGDVHPEKKTHRMQRHLLQAYFGWVLQCPKCPAVFKYGFNGIGLGLLMNHVHNCHQRLISHCRSVIKRQYAVLIADYKEHGKGCVFQSIIKSGKCGGRKKGEGHLGFSQCTSKKGFQHHFVK